MKNQVVLVTGGTGSFGRRFVAHALEKGARKVIVFSRDEHKQVAMEREVDDGRCRYILGDIRNRLSIRRACRAVDTVVHAAAIKHVDKCEYSPFEAIQTNILGAQNVVDAAIDAKVGRVLAISTDKAVNPCNLYGAAKLCADKLFVTARAYVGDGYPIFAVIRFGNFWGSRGSVVEYFKELKEKGSVLPITDLNMTRFFIGMGDAVIFAGEALESMRSGWVFYPKMDKWPIMDLAEKIYPRGKITVVGRRPGEKIHEDLITENDHNVYEYAKFYVKVPSNDGMLGKRIDPISITSEGE